MSARAQNQRRNNGVVNIVKSICFWNALCNVTEAVSKLISELLPKNLKSDGRVRESKRTIYQENRRKHDLKIWITLENDRRIPQRKKETSWRRTQENKTIDKWIGKSYWQGQYTARVQQIKYQYKYSKKGKRRQ